MRDKVGFAATRRRILEGKPSLRASWVAFAVANFMLEDYAAAFDVISKYNESVTNKEDTDPYEESELLLFQNLCLERRGLFAEALAHLDQFRAAIVDKLSCEVKYAQLLTLSERFGEAQSAWEKLLAAQPENYRFHCGLQIALLRLPVGEASSMFSLKRLDLPCSVLSLTDTQRNLLLNNYREQKSRAGRKIVLFLLSGSAGFEEELERFIVENLERGLPSLFHEICSLVLIPDTAAPGRLVPAKEPIDFREHMVTQLSLAILDRFTKPRNPQAALWGLFLRAHLLECGGALEAANQAIDEALAHTPTAIDVLVKKARLLKKTGNVLGAAMAMEECRALDLQDRYLNNKAAKYFLRADDTTQALATISLFTKHEGDVIKTLDYLQCSWFELESAEAYSRTKKWGLALKRFYSVRKHFVDQYDDLFDFHGYCMRKTTLRAYMDMLTTQDNSYGHVSFQRAFRGAVSILLHLLDSPEDIDGLGHLSPAERKKERLRLKKKKARDVAAKEPVNNKEKEEPSVSKPNEDEDLEGEQLLSKDFTTEIASWCALLAPHLEHCSAETLAIYCEACLRRGKLLPAVRAVSIGRAKDVYNPALHVAFVRLAAKMKGNKKVHATSLATVKEEFANLQGTSLLDFVNSYLATAIDRGSLPHVLAGLKALQVAEKAAVVQARCADIFAREDNWNRRGVTVYNVIDTAKFLTGSFEHESFTAQFLEWAKTKFGSCQFLNNSASTAGDDADQQDL
eukprot:scaffold2727_cov161-Ochromonas_danica.AAC.15